MSKKIYLDPVELAAKLDALRAKGAIIVTANGCFELLHLGHVHYLRAAKALGDVLVLAVNSDESMRRIKPDRRPVNPDVDRYEILAAFEFVDFVVPLEESTPISLLELFRPHVHAKGTDYTLARIPERETVERNGGRVELVGGPKERSTTEMLDSLKKPTLLS